MHVIELKGCVTVGHASESIYTRNTMSSRSIHVFIGLQVATRRDRETERQRDRETDRETDRPTDRQTDRETDRHTHTHTHTHTHAHTHTHTSKQASKHMLVCLLVGKSIWRFKPDHRVYIYICR